MLIRESLDHVDDRNASRDKSQSLMKRSDFSLAVCTCLVGSNNRHFTVFVLRFWLSECSALLCTLTTTYSNYLSRAELVGMKQNRKNKKHNNHLSLV